MLGDVVGGDELFECNKATQNTVAVEEDIGVRLMHVPATVKQVMKAPDREEVPETKQIEEPTQTEEVPKAKVVPVEDDVPDILADVEEMPVPSKETIQKKKAEMLEKASNLLEELD